METSVVLWTLLCLLGFIHIGNSTVHIDDKYQKSIECYECNSEYDPRCGNPFDSFSLGTVNCSLKRPLEHLKDDYPTPVLCRKTIQKVHGHTRIIRGCGYIPDERDDKGCVRRTGTHDVFIFYCSCTSNLCNKGHILQNNYSNSIITAMSFCLLISLYLG